MYDTGSPGSGVKNCMPVQALDLSIEAPWGSFCGQDATGAT